MSEPKRGRRYRWIGEPGLPDEYGDATWHGRRELEGEGLELCGKAVDCGGSCCLAPGHNHACSCVGDECAPGDCFA